MTSSSWIGERIPTLLRPTLLLLLSAWHFALTILEVVIVECRPLAIFNLTQLRLKSFARLWTMNGKAMSTEMPGPVFSLLKTCKGVVLDIGPGSGEMLQRFDPELITALYGAEPAEDLHPGLLRNAKETGLGAKYHALLCGGQPESLIPALHKTGIMNKSGKDGLASDGLFDEICCVRVLCGVPHLEQTVVNLYTLLKPGGRMVICEHVANPWRTEGRLLARLMQVIYTLLGWPFFMGGCELQRHTRDLLRNAGEWDRFDLNYYESRDAIPWVVGELVKKSETVETKETMEEANRKTDENRKMNENSKVNGNREKSEINETGETWKKEENRNRIKTMKKSEKMEKSYAEAVKA